MFLWDLNAFCQNTAVCILSTSNDSSITTGGKFPSYWYTVEGHNKDWHMPKNLPISMGLLNWHVILQNNQTSTRVRQNLGADMK